MSWPVPHSSVVKLTVYEDKDEFDRFVDAGPPGITSGTPSRVCDQQHTGCAYCTRFDNPMCTATGFADVGTRSLSKSRCQRIHVLVLARAQTIMSVAKLCFLNVVSFLAVPCPVDRLWAQGLACSALVLDGARLVLPATSHLGKLVIMLSSLWYQAWPFELMVCLVRPCYSVVPGLPCWPLVETTPVSLGLLRSARLVLWSHFELKVCVVRPAGRWHQACPAGHACG